MRPLKKGELNESFENRAVDAALADYLNHKLGPVFHADYLVEEATAFSINAVEPLRLYFGMGARIAVIDRRQHDGDFAIGPRVPVGVSYDLINPDLQLFGELALILNIIPDTSVNMDAAIRPILSRLSPEKCIVWC